MTEFSTLLQEFDGRPLLSLCAGLASFIALRALLGVARARVKRLTDGTERWWDDVFSETLAATHTLSLAYVSVYVAAKLTTLPPALSHVLDRGLAIAVALQIGLWGSRAIRSWIGLRKQSDIRRGETSALASLGIAKFVALFVLWLTILLLTLDNLGFNITALVASLGVGGIAIALAVQSILGDLFASLSIALDEPFVVGDFIVVDDLMGTVKHVGLKTTRLQSLGGEELIFSNADLLRSRIRNYKSMTERRILFQFGIGYATSAAGVEEAIAITQSAIAAHDCVRLDRVHFKEFGDSSLVLEAVYFMLDPDYNHYMDVQQSINLRLLDRFADSGIEFAFPTQTVHVASLPATAPQQSK
jgi:small-conductance mechanosensitive channel